MNLQKILKRYTFLVLIAGIIILLDQVSKTYIRAEFPEGMRMWSPWPWLEPYARIVHITNTGVAFGMFQGMWMIFAVLALIVSIAIIYYFSRVPEEDWVLRLSMSMMLAGAMGNLIDRATQQGKVTDFISVGNFPVFNVADSSITVGVIILIIGMWFQEMQQKRAKEAENRLKAALENDTPAQDNRAG